MLINFFLLFAIILIIIYIIYDKEHTKKKKKTKNKIKNNKTEIKSNSSNSSNSSKKKNKHLGGNKSDLKIKKIEEDNKDYYDKLFENINLNQEYLYEPHDKDKYDMYLKL
tara:strand:+ start:627 stop:956 length:330 start_codon:yes stop_codon:yes gene_type:complete